MRPRSVLLAAATAVAAVAGVLAPASPASAVPVNGQIAYVRPDNGAGNPDVWLANPDGSNKRVVLRNTQHFRWSPDGTRVSYIQFSQVTGVDTLFVAAANLTGRRSFGRADGADWTGDGTALVVERQLANGSRDLFLQPAAGGTAVRLTRAAARGCSAGSPDVSGTTVAYLLDCTALATPTVQLRTATLTGTALTADTARVTATQDPAMANRADRVDEARFRADGRLLFAGCLRPASCPANAAANLYELNGATLTRLTALAPGAGAGFRGLAPAPVGTQLAVGLQNAAGSRVLVRPAGTVIDPLGDGAEDWQLLLAP